MNNYYAILRIKSNAFITEIKKDFREGTKTLYAHLSKPHQEKEFFNIA